MELKGSSQAKYDNDGGSKSDQNYRSRAIFRQKKGSEWMEKTLLFITKYWVSLDIGA